MNISIWFDLIQNIKQYRYIAHIKYTIILKIAIIKIYTYSKTFKDNMPRITL